MKTLQFQFQNLKSKILIKNNVLTNRPELDIDHNLGLNALHVLEMQMSDAALYVLGNVI